jgi:hypothetical protein
LEIFLVFFIYLIIFKIYILFSLKEISQFLSPSTQKEFVSSVNRDSANDKINGLLIKKNDFIDEMEHN